MVGIIIITILTSTAIFVGVIVDVLMAIVVGALVHIREVVGHSSLLRLQLLLIAGRRWWWRLHLVDWRNVKMVVDDENEDDDPEMVEVEVVMMMVVEIMFVVSVDVVVGVQCQRRGRSEDGERRTPTDSNRHEHNRHTQRPKPLLNLCAASVAAVDKGREDRRG